MNNSDKALEQSTKDEAILQAIAELSKKFDERIGDLENRLDSFEKDTNAQFKAIRQGIVDNSVRFDRLEARIYEARSDISNLKADVKELTEEIRQNRKVLV